MEMKVSRKELRENIKNFPSQCGVYLMKNINSHIIYIGKARNLKSRIQSYFSSDKGFKNIFLTPRIYYIEYILTDTEVEAYLLEASLVKKYKPRYNVRLKDDKSYPYIRCSIEESFPRFYVERKVKKKGSLYFGPYTESFFARRMVRFLNEQFKIRDCSNHFMKGRDKPCLTYHIGLCTAPCVEKVNKEDYLQQVKKSLVFLRGKGKSVLKDMEKQMQRLSEEQRFEEAARVRDRMKAIQFCREKQSVVTQKQKNLDVIAFYSEREAALFQILHIRAGAVVGHRFHYESHFFSDYFCSFIIQYYMDNLVPELILFSDKCSSKKEKKKLSSTLEAALCKAHEKLNENHLKVCVREPKGNLEKKLMEMAFKNAKSHFEEQQFKKQTLVQGLEMIQKKFHLKEFPERIECFDVSHFQGRDQVASQVVFEEALPKKEDYRRYKIKKVKGVDDFASLKEVLDRRFKHSEYPDPDLLVVDGGKGQLQKALLVLKMAGLEKIPVVAIAKARVKSDFASKEIRSGKERFFLPGRKNPVVFPSHSEALRILMHLRDEAHRFAIAYHRRLAQKSVFT